MWVLLLLLAWCGALISCAGLCAAAFAVDRPRPVGRAAGGEAGAGSRGDELYETAFLSGGPHRVADLALVRLSRQRRVHLAHTGYATVVDPSGRDEIERALIDAVGPEGQSPVPAIRAAFADEEAVRSLDARLVAAGLAVPGAARLAVRRSLRMVGASAALTAALLPVAAALRPQGLDGVLAGWFALPLLTALGALAIAYIEIGPGTGWASAAGRARLLAHRIPAPRCPGTGREPEQPRAADGGQDRGGEREQLTALAVHGPAALRDPALRAALGAWRRAAPCGPRPA